MTLVYSALLLLSNRFQATFHASLDKSESELWVLAVIATAIVMLAPSRLWLISCTSFFLRPKVKSGNAERGKVFDTLCKVFESFVSNVFKNQLQTIYHSHSIQTLSYLTHIFLCYSLSVTYAIILTSLMFYLSVLLNRNVFITCFVTFIVLSDPKVPYRELLI